MEESFAGTARTLAQTYAPDWSIPSGLQSFALSDRVLAEYFRLSRDVAHLRAARIVVSERLDAIESGWYYEWRGIGSDMMRAALDKAECYHRLWWIDMFIKVHQP